MLWVDLKALGDDLSILITKLSACCALLQQLLVQQGDGPSIECSNVVEYLATEVQECRVTRRSMGTEVEYGCKEGSYIVPTQVVGRLRGETPCYMCSFAWG